MRMTHNYGMFTLSVTYWHPADPGATTQATKAFDFFDRHDFIDLDSPGQRQLRIRIQQFEHGEGYDPRIRSRKYYPAHGHPLGYYAISVPPYWKSAFLTVIYLQDIIVLACHPRPVPPADLHTEFKRKPPTIRLATYLPLAFEAA